MLPLVGTRLCDGYWFRYYWAVVGTGLPAINGSINGSLGKDSALHHDGSPSHPCPSRPSPSLASRHAATASPPLTFLFLSLILAINCGRPSPGRMLLAFFGFSFSFQFCILTHSSAGPATLCRLKNDSMTKEGAFGITRLADSRMTTHSLGTIRAL